MNQFSLAAVRGDDEDIFVSVTVGPEGHRFAVGGPNGSRIPRWMLGETTFDGTFNLMKPDIGARGFFDPLDPNIPPVGRKWMANADRPAAAR